MKYVIIACIVWVCAACTPDEICSGRDMVHMQKEVNYERELLACQKENTDYAQKVLELTKENIYLVNLCITTCKSNGKGDEDHEYCLHACDETVD